MKNILLLITTSFLISCAEAPESDEAQTGAAQETQTVSSEAVKFLVDVQQSKLKWIGTKPTGQHNGIVKISEGRLSLRDGKIVAGNFVMDMNSIEGTDQTPEDNKDLSDHLKDKDFFMTAKYPTAKFEIISVSSLDTNIKSAMTDEPVKEKSIQGANMTLTGNLTIMDSVKSISFPAKISVMENQITAEANFNIDRTKWGVSYKSEKNPQNKFIYKAVNIGMKLVVNKQ